MTLIRWELRKLFRLPALWVFVGLCLALNGALVYASAGAREEFGAASAAAADLGQRVDDRFRQGLARRPAGPERDALLAAVADLEDVYEAYDAASLADRYAAQLAGSPAALRWMEGKYELLAARTAELAATDAALDLYGGPATHAGHQGLFGTVLHALLAEACLLAMLSALYLTGFERMARTEALVCSTRTGRRLCRRKLEAALLASLCLYGLLLLPTLAAWFTVWDYGGVWSANVSSQFNYVREVFGVKPFLTWGDFTVAGYLAATLALGAVLTAVFCLLAAACGLLMRNTYAAALTVTVLLAGMLAAAVLCSDLRLWPGYFAAALQPALLWLLQPGWFTDLGLNAVLPWHETVGAALDLLLYGGAALLALRHFSRKDLS